MTKRTVPALVVAAVLAMTGIAEAGETTVCVELDVVVVRVEVCKTFD